MITDIEEFIKYFHGQRRRTQWVIDLVPPDKGNWRPWPDEPSFAEVVRRIAAGHLMYARAVAYDYWEIDEYESIAVDWEDSVNYFHQKTEEALDCLRPLRNTVLQEKRRRPEDQNIPTSAWRYLMAMVEHEIFHRAQLNSYLMLLNIRRPQMGGVSIEAVRKALENR